jgi:hypothetical protein
MRYTRDQILTAFVKYFEKKSSNREGAAVKKFEDRNTFINLIKSDENFLQQLCMMIMQ